MNLLVIRFRETLPTSNGGLMSSKLVSSSVLQESTHPSMPARLSKANRYRSGRQPSRLGYRSHDVARTKRRGR